MGSRGIMKNTSKLIIMKIMIMRFSSILMNRKIIDIIKLLSNNNNNNNNDNNNSKSSKKTINIIKE